MTIETAIARFRAKQAEQFSDEATVARQDGELTTNSTTGEVSREFDEVYDGPCKIRPADRTGRDVEAGETELRLVTMIGKFPVDSDIRRDDIVTVVASTYDAGMVDRQYRVTDAPGDGWQIARVVYLEETVVPELHGS